MTDIKTITGREILKYACQRQIFSPYGGGILDMRRAVLIDGSDYGGKMSIMTTAEYDKVLAALTASGTTLAGAFGHEVVIYDGRSLFGKARKSASA